MQSQDLTSETIAPLQVTGTQLAEQVERALVTNDETLSKAGDLYKIIGNQIKKSEDGRKFLVKPLNDHVKNINSQFKPITTHLDTIKSSLKSKMDSYVSDREAEARKQASIEKAKAEEEALKRAEELQANGNSELAEDVMDAAASLPDKPKSQIARGSYGSSTSSKINWKAECIDIKEMCRAIADGKLPEDFILVNQPRLNKLAVSKKEEKTNFGIKIFSVTSASVR